MYVMLWLFGLQGATYGRVSGLVKIKAALGISGSHGAICMVLKLLNRNFSAAVAVLSHMMLRQLLLFCV